jgi:hypothetical protein
VNWNPDPVDLDAHRQRVLDLTIRRLRKAYDDNAAMMDLSWFYEDREKSVYINDACDSLQRYVDQNWTDPNGAYQYSVWGLTQIGEWLVDYIAQKYPNAKLCHVYDSFRSAKFKGLTSVHPDVIAQVPEEFVFVTTNGAEKAAREMFEKINKPAGSYRSDEVIANLKKFEGRFILQTMFLRSPDFDTAAPEALGRWMDIVRELKPREVMVYTIDRETPDQTLGKYTVDEMTEMVRPLIEEGYSIQIRG